MEIRKHLNTSSPKIVIEDINKSSNVQCANSETTCNKNEVLSDPYSRRTESVVKSNPDTNIKKLIYDQLGMWCSKYLLNMYYQGEGWTFYIVYKIKTQ